MAYQVEKLVQLAMPGSSASVCYVCIASVINSRIYRKYGIELNRPD